MEPLKIEDVRKHLLAIAQEFHRVCVANNIPYYMVGGTLLGAVRHKGFIPWDDDMDFAILRKDEKKLVSLLETSLTYPYSLVKKEKGSYVSSNYKIQDETTKVDDPMTKRFGTNLGLTLDIFVFDNCSLDANKISFIMKKVKIVNAIGTILFSNPTKKKWWVYPLKSIVRLLLFWVTPKVWLKWFNSLEKQTRATGNEAFVNLSGMYGVKEIVPEYYLGQPKLYQFEDTEFYGPSDYDNYLKHIYNDYMKLPSIDKQVVHCDGYYLK